MPKSRSKMRAERLGRKADEFTQKAAMKASDLREKAEKKLEEAKQKFAYTESKIRGYINSNPEKALLIAAGIGVAIGAIATSMFKGQKHGR